MSKKCDCHSFYLFGKKAACLHKLFAQNRVGLVAQIKTRYTTKLFIYMHQYSVNSKEWKRGWWKNGLRSEITSKEQAMLVLELAKQYNVRMVRV